MTETGLSRPFAILVSRDIVQREDGKILLLKRAAGDSHRPGFWEVPGGKVEAGQDETLQEAGIRILVVDRYVYTDSYIAPVGKHVGLPYIVFFNVVRPEGSTDIVLSSEHDAYAWESYSDALKYELTPETRKAFLALESRLA